MWRRTTPPPKAARYKNTTGDTIATSVQIVPGQRYTFMDIMKTLSGVQLCFVLLCLAACMAECKEPKRSKLSSDFGLTPFLRSGRGSEHSWDANVDVKRKIGKMVSFPRIGRSESWGADENNYGAKRPGANSGMWFGPRLGRVQKRSDEYTPWTYIIVNGEGPVTRQVHYTPRLGRESEEVYDDLDAEDVA